MNKKIIYILVGMSLLGAILSGIHVKQHLINIATGFEEKSFCNINEVINCDLVDASPYSQIKGIPVSGLSLFFHVVLIIFLLRGVLKDKLDSIVFGLLMTIAGFIFSLWMAYISFFVLKLACLVCIGLYIVSTASLLLFPLGISSSYKTSLEVMKEYISNQLVKSFIPHAIISLVILGLGVSFLHSKVKAAENEWAVKRKMEQLKKNPEQADLPVEELVKLFFGQPAIELNTTGQPVKGNPNAKVKVVEFSDFECPFCRRAAETFKPVIEEYKDDIAFYFINYPLDKACNKNLQRELHKTACAAAVAAACAGAQDQFWAYHDTLFENQGKYSPEELKSYAEKIGINVDKQETCLKDPKILEGIEQDIALGQTAQIQGTPSVFVNGRRFNGWNKPELLKAVLDEVIKQVN